MEKEYSISDKREDRAFAGASMGGLVSFFLAVKMRDSFGSAICQSGAFLFPQIKMPRNPGSEKIHRFLASVRMSSLKRTKIWLDCGNIGRMESQLLEGNRILRQKLADAGVDHRFREVDEAHNWGSWRKRLEEALVYVFGP